jgi:hypothetical protein
VGLQVVETVEAALNCIHIADTPARCACGWRRAKPRTGEVKLNLVTWTWWQLQLLSIQQIG